MNVLGKLKEAREYYLNTYGIQPTEKQLTVLECKEESLVTIFERCEGCSTAATIKAIEFAINNQGSRVLIVVPSHNIAIMYIDRIRKMFENKRLKQHALLIVKNPCKVELLNGSIIEIISGRAESLRGRFVDCVIIEPERSINADVVEMAKISTCASKNRQIIVLDQIDYMNGQPINI